MMKSWPYILVIVIFLAVRLPGLGWDILNSDGARWHRRSERFLTALKTGDLRSTYQHYQPGVSLMWINAATKQTIWGIQDMLRTPRWSLENSSDFPKIHAVSKIVLVTSLMILLIYQMLIISRITNIQTALVYGVLVSTEPYLIGIDRWFHLTSLEIYFAFSAYLTYLYSFIRQNKRVLVSTGALIALSTLSKLTGIVVLLPILLIELARGFYTKNMKSSLISVGLVLSGFSVASFMLFPALWVDGVNVIIELSDAAVSAVGDGVGAQYFKSKFSYAYYILILAFKLSPITLSIFTASIVLFIRKVRQKDVTQGRFILAYFLTFFLALTMSEKKIDRYVLALFQPLILFISIHLVLLRRRYLLGIITFQLAISAIIFWSNFPAISGYYSPVFGGAKEALNLGVYDNSGEYFAQSALYLNQKGHVDVLVPDNYESFKYFYDGNTLIENVPPAKYVVTSVDFDRKVPKVTENCKELERTFGPRVSMPYIYVYACKN